MLTKHRIALISFAALLVALALPVAAQEPCVGLPECYEPTPAPPSSGGSTSPSSAPAAPPWSGLGDGRLNPQMDEYYSLYCKHTFLEIWRGVPTGSLLQFVPIWLLAGLDEDGGTVEIPYWGEIAPFTITRNGDAITVSGTHGNLDPQPGSKSFSLSDCIARNDGPIGSAPPSSQPSTGFVDTTLTMCYGRDTEAVRQGRVPPDQICDENVGIVAVEVP